MWYERTLLQIGEEGFERLRNSNVLVVGLGGVGAYAAEMICRAGVGRMTIVDGDTVNTSNRNRQLAALTVNEGRMKADVMAERLLLINPELQLTVVPEYIKDDKMFELLSHDFDYVVDAIDTISPKVFLIYHSIQKKLKIVSSMGAGGKYDSEMIRISDISKSYNCKLALVVRKRLHKMGVYKGIKVVFSPEGVAPEMVMHIEGENNKKTTVGTLSYMPALFGCHLSSVVIRDLISKGWNNDDSDGRDSIH